MTFGFSSSCSKREQSAQQPRPHQRTQSTPSTPGQYARSPAPSPYAIPSGAFSVNIFHAPPHPTSPSVYGHSNIAAASMVHLPHQPYPQSQPPHSVGAAPAPVQHSWCSQSRRPELSKWASYTNLNQSLSSVVSSVKSQTVGKANATLVDLHQLVRQSVRGDGNVRDVTSRLLDQVITSIDLGSFCGRENELCTLT